MVVKVVLVLNGIMMCKPQRTLSKQGSLRPSVLGEQVCAAGLGALCTVTRAMERERPLWDMNSAASITIIKTYDQQQISYVATRTSFRQIPLVNTSKFFYNIFNETLIQSIKTMI